MPKMNDGDDIQDLIQKKTTLLSIVTYFSEQSWANENRKKTRIPRVMDSNVAQLFNERALQTKNHLQASLLIHHQTSFFLQHWNSLSLICEHKRCEK